jgi:hypothetical protein
MSFAITNNLLIPMIRATNLGISPQATTWNNSKNPKGGSFGMKHLERCSSQKTHPKKTHPKTNGEH